jgi:hypothetical protein
MTCLHAPVLDVVSDYAKNRLKAGNLRRDIRLGRRRFGQAPQKQSPKFLKHTEVDDSDDCRSNELARDKRQSSRAQSAGMLERACLTAGTTQQRELESSEPERGKEGESMPYL